MLANGLRATTKAGGYGSLLSQGRRRNRGRHLVPRV